VFAPGERHFCVSGTNVVHIFSFSKVRPRGCIAQPAARRTLRAVCSNGQSIPKHACTSSLLSTPQCPLDGDAGIRDDGLEGRIHSVSRL